MAILLIKRKYFYPHLSLTSVQREQVHKIKWWARLASLIPKYYFEFALC